jgi:hypothetical protein
VSEPRRTRTPGRPWHLWLIGILGALWSAVGVFGGVIGCLLLLLKRRLAVHVLLASAIGAIVSNLGGLFLLGGMEVMGETGGLGFSTIPIIFGAFMALYARAMRKAGVLS